jgi:hypothetical protein
VHLHWGLQHDNLWAFYPFSRWTRMRLSWDNQSSSTIHCAFRHTYRSWQLNSECKTARLRTFGICLGICSRVSIEL